MVDTKRLVEAFSLTEDELLQEGLRSLVQSKLREETVRAWLRLARERLSQEDSHAGS
ncbi:MAG: hypothetical protein ACP5OO_09915 [Chloroflexia bacterium]